MILFLSHTAIKMRYLSVLFLLLFVPICYVTVCYAPVCYAEVVQIESVDVGIEGLYKNGFWTPVAVQWSKTTDANPVTEIELTNCDSDGTPMTYKVPVATAIHLTPNQVQFFVKLGRADSPITVRLILQDGSAVEKQLTPEGDPAKQKSDTKPAFRFLKPLDVERPVFLIIANKNTDSENLGLQGAVAHLSLPENLRPLLVKTRSVAELPRSWHGYEIVDTAILTTTEPGQFTEIAPIESLETWLRQGGRMLFCAGKDSESLLVTKNTEGQTEPGILARFLPGTFQMMTDLRRGSPLEVFAGSNRPILMNGTEENPFLVMPALENPRGLISIRDGNLPILLRTAFGFGVLTYFGGDLDNPSLVKWQNRDIFVRNIMQWNTEKQMTSQSSVALIQLGYNDMSGQLRSALDRFSGVWIVPFSLLLILLTVYLLIIGPVDWFLVQKILKKPVLTWATFPVFVVLFVLLAYWLSVSGRPNQLMLNELQIYDVDFAEQTNREVVWGTLYSPSDARFDVQYAGNATIFSWHGLTGSGLGGMNPKTFSPTIWREGSVQHLDQPESLRGVPIPVRATKCFFGLLAPSVSAGENRQNVSAFSPSLTLRASNVSASNVGAEENCQLKDEDGILLGEVTNPYNFTLENVQVFYGRWVQHLGRLEPNQTVTIHKDSNATPRWDIREILVPPESSSQADRKIAMYNPQSTDIGYIVRIMSLYRAVGGFNSTKLYMTQQSMLDMSDLLSVDRAVMIGSVAASPLASIRIFSSNSVSSDSEAELTPQANVQKIYRFSLPVVLTTRSPRHASYGTGTGIGRDALESKERESTERYSQ